MRVALMVSILLGCRPMHGQCPGITPSFTWMAVDSAVLFSDVTETYGLSVDGRWWEFGDGYQGAASDTAITYLTTDADLVRLHLWIGGCEFIDSALVAHGDANDICMASIEPDFNWDQPANNQISFTNATTSSGVNLVSVWDYGDGQFGYSPDPTYTYLYPGRYETVLSLAGIDSTTGDGCVAGKLKRILVDGNASTCDTSLFLDFDYSFDGEFAQFYSIIDPLNADLLVTASVWDMGDGSSTITSNPAPSHVFVPQGVHQVCLMVWAETSTDDCWATVCHTLEMNAVAVPEVERSDELQAWPVPFEDGFTVRGDLRGVVHFTLYDRTGRAVDERSAPMNGEVTLNYAGLSPGAYLLRASTPSQRAWCRVVKL